MGAVLVYGGGLLALVGAIWIAVIAFQSGEVVWGLLCIFCCMPIVAIIYAAQHQDKARTPMFIAIGGLILQVIGAFLGGVSIPESP
jgi:hypothetical protein